MAIYTRTGDKGKTSLFNGQRVLKSDLRVETYGTIDELNSALGVVLAEVQSSPPRWAGKFKIQSYSLKLKVELEKIQNDLLDIGSALANPSTSDPRSATSHLVSRVKEFEKFIDQMTEKMPPLKNFILPGGGQTGAMLHLARAISRRAERRIVGLNIKNKVDNNIIIYINRLSDLLFTMARFSNFKEKKKEIIWRKR
ncbi:MAG: cob(I)yrinic acid a,c-diamide adenosyltransferase [bacterium]|nr:cob(I)yrinic acid a,c-diamide adenosyltransferase [bacterium]